MTRDEFSTSSKISSVLRIMYDWKPEMIPFDRNWFAVVFFLIYICIWFEFYTKTFHLKFVNGETNDHSNYQLIRHWTIESIGQFQVKLIPGNLVAQKSNTRKEAELKPHQSGLAGGSRCVDSEVFRNNYTLFCSNSNMICMYLIKIVIPYLPRTSN